MTDIEIIQICTEEVEQKNWGVTEQFLDIHSLVYEAGKLKIERIDRDNPDGTLIAYIPVRDERFYLAIYVKANPDPEIVGVGTEPYQSVYFRATSKTLDFDQLSCLTKLKPTSGWSKGEMRKIGKGEYDFTSLEFLPNPEPDEFEDKLNNLLDFLEQDEEGIKKLVEMSDGYIQVAMIFHNGNTMLGGPHISTNAIKRMNALNLEIDFDLYANGKYFK
jgi:hypothetical protein